MGNFAALKCVPCRGGDPPASEAEIAAWLPKIPGWQILEVEGIQRLERSYKFKNFVMALAFANKVGEIAEEEGHHPVLLVTWGKVTVTWWTHVIRGLHRNDFIMAAKTDQLYNS